MLYADFVAFNGHLLTQNDAAPVASALAVRDGRIVFVGDDRTALELAGPTTWRIDLGGKSVVPGFCDAHIHLHWFGNLLLTQADLVGSASVADVVERLARHASRSANGWIRGHGFDQEKLADGQFPTRADLDQISTARPILITRICGHAAVVNSAALQLVTEAERARGDQTTGLYTEGDIAPFHRAVPPPSPGEAEQGVLLAQDVLLKTGITSVQTLLDTTEQMATYARLRRRGMLKIRISAMPPAASVGTLEAHGINTTFGDDLLRFGAAKLFSDGSFGARTALLADPYADDSENPQNVGIRIYPTDDLKQRTRAAQNAGFQVAIHAIGDQAVRESLDALLFALDESDNETHRHRIEHVSLLSPDLMQTMAQRQIVAVVQPQFVRSDVWTGERVGTARTAWAYPFCTMLRAGIPLALSSDCPVEEPNAFACLAAATGRASWSPDETLTIAEAIRAYTMGSQFAGHFENKAGSLELGKLADFVVLSENPLPLVGDDLLRLCAEQVYIGGRRVDANADVASSES